MTHLSSTKSFIFSLVCLVLISVSCSEDESSFITSADIENAFQAFEVKVGTQDLELEVAEGVTYSFRVIFPAVDLTQNWPLVLTLHGASGGDPNAHTYTDCYVEPGLEDLDAIILSPNGGASNWQTLGNNDKLRILTDLATRFWPVDISKIAITGYSNGGNGSWYYAETQPTFFSAAIPIAAGYVILNANGSARKVDIPIYAIHGENDELFPLDTVQYWAEQTALVGTDIEFVVAEGLGHTEPCNYEEYFKGAAEWLKNEIWN